MIGNENAGNENAGNGNEEFEVEENDEDELGGQSNKITTGIDDDDDDDKNKQNPNNSSAINPNTMSDELKKMYEDLEDAKKKKQETDPFVNKIVEHQKKEGMKPSKALPVKGKSNEYTQTYKSGNATLVETYNDDYSNFKPGTSTKISYEIKGGSPGTEFFISLARLEQGKDGKFVPSEKYFDILKVSIDDTGQQKTELIESSGKDKSYSRLDPKISKDKGLGIKNALAHSKSSIANGSLSPNPGLPNRSSNPGMVI